MQTRSITAALLAVSATALLLTGCAQQSTDHTTSGPTPSASSTVDARDTPAPYDNACDGKQTVVSGDGAPHEVGDCDAVAVVSKGSKITVGTAKSIVVEGSNNEITVGSVESITLLGSNNEVHVEGGTPQVDDQGQGNSVH